jgi:hypothetical protein
MATLALYMSLWYIQELIVDTARITKHVVVWIVKTTKESVEDTLSKIVTTMATEEEIEQEFLDELNQPQQQKLRGSRCDFCGWVYSTQFCYDRELVHAVHPNIPKEQLDQIDGAIFKMIQKYKRDIFNTQTGGTCHCVYKELELLLKSHRGTIVNICVKTSIEIPYRTKFDE